MAEIYGLSRREACRFCSAGMGLIIQDFEEINIDRPQMVVKLLVNLEQGLQKGLFNNQSRGVAACARQIISLAGLADDPQYNSRGRKLLNRISLYLLIAI